MPSGNPNMGTNRTTGTGTANRSSPGAPAGTGVRSGGGAVSSGSAAASSGSRTGTGSAGSGNRPASSASPGARPGTGSRPSSAGGAGYSGSTGGYASNNALNNSLAGLNRTDRSLVEAGSLLGRGLGIGTHGGILAASEGAKMGFGELGSGFATPDNLAAIERNYANRLGLMANFGRYHGSIPGVLAGYDATGYGHQFGRSKALANQGISPLGNSAFQSAKFGTPGYGAALNALMGQLTGTGPELPGFVANSTNYHNPDISSPSWGKNAQSFGPHAFNNPDKGFGPGVVQASTAAMLSGAPPQTSIAATSAPSVKTTGYDMTRANAIPESLEQQAGLQPKTTSPMIGQGVLNPRVASIMNDYSVQHTAPQYASVEKDQSRLAADPGKDQARLDADYTGSSFAKSQDRLAPETTIAGRPEFTGSFPSAKPQLASAGIGRNLFDTQRGIAGLPNPSAYSRGPGPFGLVQTAQRDFKTTTGQPNPSSYSVGPGYGDLVQGRPLDLGSPSVNISPVADMPSSSGGFGHDRRNDDPRAKRRRIALALMRAAQASQPTYA